MKTIQIPGGPQVSKGTAAVYFRTKEEAGLALQKLYFEPSLGDKLRVDY